MKRLFLTISAAAALAVCNADTQVAFPKTAHNFGAFAEEDGPVSCRFPIVNTGNEELVILNVHASCGCTQPKYPRNPVAPGDTAYIDVTFDPSYRPGIFDKTISVETNTNPAKNRLSIKGTVIGSPSTIQSRYPHDFGALKLDFGEINFGDVISGSFESSHLRAYNMSADTIHVDAVPAGIFMEAETSPNPIPPGRQAIIVVSYNNRGEQLYGYQETTVDISVDGSEPKSVPVTINLVEDFSTLSDSDRAKAPVAALSSDRINVGTILNAARAIDTGFQITNQGQHPLVVRRVYTLDPGVDISLDTKTLKHGESATVNLVVHPSEMKGGMVNAKVMVLTNDPASPIQTVRIVGEYAEIQRVR